MLPITTYVWKIASGCNLNCTYCYVYNLADTSWRAQPALMSEEVARRSATRILDHCRRHEVNVVSIILHGGEPLIGGLPHLRVIVEAIERVFAGSCVHVRLGMQSNLLLFTAEIGSYLLEKRVTLGVSLDGPPEINDLQRVDRRGRGTSARLEAKLSLLNSPRYRPLFHGFLCVIDPQTDPVHVTDYLLSFDPPVIDFLLPLNNYDSRPIDGGDGVPTPFGRWLTRCYDYWKDASCRTKIKLFESIHCLLCGRPSFYEIIGPTPVALAVIETNGEIEGLDALKSAYQGATMLGCNVFDDDFDAVAGHPNVAARQRGVDGLCDTCKSCSLVDVCGGGYLPHRYSSINGFDNPSIYCEDLQMLIRHIYASMRMQLAGSGV